MKKVLSFGDVHFSAMNAWNIDAGENFIRWFDEQDFGPKEDVEFLFTGDISERDVNPGIVIDQMNRLFNLCSKKGAATWICVGNHDKKLYHDRLQNSLIFLENIEGVHVINEAKTVVSKNGFKILVMPHLHTTEMNSMTLHDFYNQMIDSEGFIQEWDICTGHWNIAEGEGHGFKSEGVKIDKLRPHVKSWSLGHIHTRSLKEYCGSIWPNKYDEQFSLYKRCYKEYNENEQTIEMPLPEFLHFEELEFGKEPPERKENCAYVYTILNCKSEKLAREKYPTIYIRGIEQQVKADFSNLSSDSSRSGFNQTYSESYSEMIKELKIKVTRAADGIIKGILREKDESKTV